MFTSIECRLKMHPEMPLIRWHRVDDDQAAIDAVIASSQPVVVGMTDRR
jgi:hypothetical protein